MKYTGGCTNGCAARRRLGARADTLVLQTAADLPGVRPQYSAAWAAVA
jgi:hypothetical protein